MIGFIDSAIGALRPVFLVLAAVLAGIATVDWLVRTRRISPFGRIARVFHRSVDPLLMPIERRVVRAGGLPSSAPFWALMMVVLAGIVLIAGLGFVRDEMAFILGSLGAGPRGVYRLAVSWVAAVLQLAIIVRVVLSWVHGRPGAWYARWSYRLSEPILQPIRNLIPLVGTVDVSPIIGWFALAMLESLLLAAW